MPLLRMSILQTKSPSQPRDRAVEALVFFPKKVSRHKLLRVAILLFLAGTCPAPALAQLYGGVLGGVSTLSGDARSLLNPGSTAFSSYDPSNGGAVEVLMGKHFSDYFSAQASYIWNSNDLTLTAASFNNGMQVGYQERRSSSQQSLIGDVLVYFRGRNSRLRPYLSVGTGFVHFASTQERLQQLVGTPALPPQGFSSNAIVLNVPVGIDVSLGRGWAFRYTFSETISQNPISDRLSPPGQHTFKNFENLFGFIRRF
jgi:outer membrane protein with beta-barrel domain